MCVVAYNREAPRVYFEDGAENEKRTKAAGNSVVSGVGERIAC